jgi:LPXTG-site transpeptidase (sortase) family protein
MSARGRPLRAGRLAGHRAAAGPAGPAALLALLAAVLTGCSSAAAGPTTLSGGAPAARPSAAQSAVADGFHSTRTYQNVAVPVRIRIPKIGVDSELIRLNRQRDGSLATPTDGEHAGWWVGGARPGQPGPAVIAGHVDWDHSLGVFFHLLDLRPGDLVYVDRADHTTARFRVTSLTEVPKSRFPTDLVFAQDLHTSLRLVTCGGVFDHDHRTYLDNVIVFAVPA